MAELKYLYTPLLLNTALKCCYNVISMSYLDSACKINLILCETSEYFDNLIYSDTSQYSLVKTIFLPC